VKSSQQILRLPVLSIEEGKQIGEVRHLVLNPQQGKIDFILVEDKTWYFGLKAMAFNAIQGIGEFALTVAGRSSLSVLSECAGLIDLLENNICLSGIKVLSKKGRLVGSISEYFINDNTGDIIGCQLIPVNSEKPAGMIPKKLILTYGCDFLVVEEGVEEKLVAELQEENIADNWENSTKTKDTAAVPAIGKQPAEALKHFEEQQRQYLLGRKVTMRIVADNGEVVAEDGETITDEIIERAKAADRYIQLTMNIRE